MEYREIEVRFLEIDKDTLIKKLHSLDAVDHGEQMLEDIILYDEALTWREHGDKLLRLRTRGGKVFLAYKHREAVAVDGTEEIEFEVSDLTAAEVLLSRIGFPAYRHQQKLRHSFTLQGVTIDIDTWPRIPTYVELEGQNEVSIRKVAEILGFDWGDVELRIPRAIIEEEYGVPVGRMRFFTFDRFE